ncbi:hypothetical protein [Microvirgula aerodenitrificans]|uniref:hypothetical protein n=1 Tax=Microvirgula aerodenitrificans TaxID=57480 RepID=UPI002F42EDD6
MPAPSSPVTLLVTRRIAPERHDDFVAWMQRGQQLAAQFAGYLGSGTLAPAPGDDNHQIVFRFSDDASLARWADSPERRDWLRQGTGLVHDSQVHEARGLDHGFAVAPPPRWKQAVTIWLVFFPVSLAFTLLFGASLASLPVVLRVLASTLMLTPVMVFVFIPFGTRLLHRWLHPGATTVAGLLNAHGNRR